MMRTRRTPPRIEKENLYVSTYGTHRNTCGQSRRAGHGAHKTRTASSKFEVRIEKASPPRGGAPGCPGRRMTKPPA